MKFLRALYAIPYLLLLTIRKRVHKERWLGFFLVLITHCVKSVRIRSFSGLYFPAFRLNMERYSESFRIQSECRKIQTRKTLSHSDNFYDVLFLLIKGNTLLLTYLLGCLLVCLLFYSITYLLSISFIRKCCWMLTENFSKTTFRKFLS